MTIQQAIKKIEEAGFTANYWSKGGKQRIYIDFKFNGSKRTGGYLCKDNSDLKAAPCGKRTAKYQSKLDQFLGLEIEWNSDVVKNNITEKQAASRAAYEISLESSYHEFGIGL